jgi:hypothetical protein
MTTSTQSTRRGGSTQRETVRLLCKSIVNRLENQKSISFPPRLRQIVQDELYALIGPYILTEEDLRNRALERIGAKAEQLDGSDYTESDQYKAAKAVIRKSFGDDELNGLYFQKPLKMVAISVVEYLMRSSHIEDVFETDEDMERMIVEIVKKFDSTALH